MEELRVEMSSLPSRRSVLAGAVLLAALAGCATNGVPGGAVAWRLVPMEDADVKPASTDPSRRTRVVVLPSEESPSAPRNAGLAAVASAALETALGAGGIEVVDRKLASRLDSELKLAELRGSGSYGGPDVADYAIRVVMGTAGGGSTFVPASTAKNIFSGKTETTPAGYTHTGTSSMTVRIYQLPSLKLVQSIPVEGKVNSVQQPGVGNAIDLARSATNEGIKSKRVAVLNEFSPKGYISERRVLEKKSIFRVQLGKQTGAKTGDTVEIMSLQKVGSNYDEIIVGKGRMSEIVGNEGSWILVDDEKVASRVRNGDFVKVKHGGILDGLKIPGM